MAKAASSDNKKIAHVLAGAFGGRCSAIEVVHDSLPLVIDLARCPDRPGEGVTSLGTIGLSDFPLYLKDEEYPVRVELVSAVASLDVDAFGLVLGTTAFCIIRSRRIVHPGSFLEDVVSVYIPESTLSHMYFTAPFLWEKDLRATQLETKKVAWLLAFPISQSELELLKEKGRDALEAEFQKHNIDIFDLCREPVI
jgi:hypothetical protein